MTHPPTVPILTLDDLKEQWAGRGPAAMVVGGFSSPKEEQHDRVGLFAWPLTGEGPLLDVWIPRADLARVEEALGVPVVEGEWDVMYATGWSMAWVIDGANVWVWTPEQGLTCEADGAHVRLGEVQVKSKEVEAVLGWLARDWVRREVRVRLKSGDEHSLVGVDVPTAAMGDMFYDGLDLMADTSWVHNLGHTIARGLGVPYIDGISI